MHRIDLGDVATIWDDLPGPFTATLTFGVGVRHETFRTLEVAHLVEHLVMRHAPLTTIDHHASVDEDTTTFSARGADADVVKFLHEVCGWIREPNLAQRAIEARVLEIEDGRPAHQTMRWAVDMRFGARTVGLLGQRGPGASRIDDHHVREFVARHYVADNAFLTMTGPPPVGLEINLPRGPRPSEQHPSDLPLRLPALISGGAPQPAMSGVVPRHDRSMAFALILRQRLFDDLRIERGLVYHVDVEAIRLDSERTLLVVHADPRDSDSEQVLQTMWEHLERFVADGPTQDELTRHRGAYEIYAQTTGLAADILEYQAYLHLYGGDSHGVEETRAMLRGLTSESVRAVAAEFRRTAVIGTPEEATVPFPGLHDETLSYPEPAELSPTRRFRGRALRGARELEVRADEVGLVIAAGSSRLASAWDDVVGVGIADGIRQFTFANGAVPWLCDRHLHRADELFRLIDEHTAAVAYELLDEHVIDC